jgi:hypothetical protein
MTAVEDELPLSDTESLGDEPPTVTQQEPTLTQQESEDEVIFDPPEEHIFEEDANSNSGIPHETTAMLTVEIDGVTYEKLGSKKSLSKTSETVLFKKEDRSNLSVDERTILFKSAVAKAHKPYDLMPLSLDDEDKLDDTYNLEVLVSKTKRAHFRYDMYNIFSIIIPNDDESIKEVKDLYSDYSNITIEQVARSNLWYREWMANVYFEQNLELTYDFFQNNVSDELSMKISETYETFAVGEQGGPLFFILMMNHLLSDSEEAAISLNERVKKFDIKNVEGENIFRVVSLLRGAVKRLQHINKMPEDIVRTLLNVMQTSSVDSFNQQFSHLQKQRKQNSVLRRTGGSASLRWEDIFVLAESEYRDYVNDNLWTGVHTKGTDSVFHNSTSTPGKAPECWNCLGPHRIDDCKQSKDQLRIQANKKKWMEKSPRHNRNRTTTGGPGQNFKFRRPESGENNQRVIDKKPHTFSWDNKRWAPDDSAIPTELKAANLAAPSTPSSSAGSVQSDPDRTSKHAMFVGSSGASLQSEPGSCHAMIAIHERMIEKVQGTLAELVTLQDSFME